MCGQIDVTGYNFSGLTIRQAYMQGQTLAQTDFSRATFQDCSFTETYGPIYSGAISPNGEWLALGTANGDIRLLRISDGEFQQVLTGHANRVQSLKF